MATAEEVKGRQFNLMLDKALKHGKLMNHWLDKARNLISEGIPKSARIPNEDYGTETFNVERVKREKQE